jgi:hypothetical protein
MSRKRRKSLIALSLIAASLLTSAIAQETNNNKPDALMIQEQGSFAVGGSVATAPGTFDPIKQGAYNPAGTDPADCGRKRTRIQRRRPPSDRRRSRIDHNLPAIPSFFHAQERQTSHERRDRPGRVPTGYRAGLEFPVRLSAAIENQCARDSDRVLPARLYSQGLLQRSALQRIVRDAGGGLTNK